MEKKHTVGSVGDNTHVSLLSQCALLWRDHQEVGMERTGVGFALQQGTALDEADKVTFLN